MSHSDPQSTTNNGPRSVLGFDFGKKRIGIAIGQCLTHTATPLTTLTSRDNKPDWEGIQALINEWRPDALVVGIPCHMDGTEHEMTQAAQRFVRQLEGRHRLPVYTMDERLTSAEAEASLREAPKKKRRRDKAAIDTIAAQVILQSWLEEELLSHDA